MATKDMEKLIAHAKGEGFVYQDQKSMMDSQIHGITDQWVSS